MVDLEGSVVFFGLGLDTFLVCLGFDSFLDSVLALGFVLLSFLSSLAEPECFDTFS